MNRRGWPLWIVALSAAVAIWAGWVKLGAFCGFGDVVPFPGIMPWHLDAAITLPAGIEAYGAYALGVWLSPQLPAGVRRFAGRSAAGALALGASAQVISHLLIAAHATRAPWPVVVPVSCVPVVTLGFAAALTHLIRSAPAEAPAEAPGEAPGPLPAATRTRPPKRAREAAPVIAKHPLDEFAAEISAAVLPSKRQVQKRMHVAWDKVDGIRADLEQAITEGKRILVPTNGSGPRPDPTVNTSLMALAGKSPALEREPGVSS